ncbi:hypothetical protein LIER_12807 [Lithospermum erythrorhizon]|uniref:CGL160/ATPI domain-containing protein n=1 Tax=Lithospermum erythrorhizon TaxID=34254 RepID=A0AAV3PTW8_LITER
MRRGVDMSDKMQSLSSVELRWIPTSLASSILGQPLIITRFVSSSSKRHRTHFKNPHTLSLLKTSISPVEDEVMVDFLKEREVNGDLIAKVFDRIFLKSDASVSLNDAFESSDELAEVISQEAKGEENNGGFLKLTTTNEWLSGGDEAPVNRKLTMKEIRDNSERRKRLNLLKYEVLKKELLLLTVGIGTACSGYCLVAFSFQAALSYATGVLFSCLYFQLLCKYADNLSKEAVPQIFMQKKAKKIGIRTEDLEDAFEKIVRGSGMALSSPRLVIPVAIYGLWELSQHLTLDLFEFQIVPAMVGIFAYKAAALVQVYRDNEDLQFIFPETEEDPRS